MDRAVKIEASLACANFKNLERDIRQLEEAKIDYIHVDMMDGTFVPNLALDFTILKAVKELTDIPVECHLMIQEPERYIERTAAFAPAFISVHVEATRHVQKALRQIRDSGVKAGIALNPATSISTLSYILDDIDLITVMMVNPGFAGQALIPATICKLADIRNLVDSAGYSNIELQVDGNVSFENIPLMIHSGATMLVGGTSSIFHKQYSIGQAVCAVRALIESSTLA
jgi:ribulose-phosphate 3-epimerase